MGGVEVFFFGTFFLKNKISFFFVLKKDSIFFIVVF